MNHAKAVRRSSKSEGGRYASYGWQASEPLARHAEVASYGWQASEPLAGRAEVDGVTAGKPESHSQRAASDFSCAGL